MYFLLCTELHIQSHSSEVTPLSVGRRATRDEWLQINELNSEVSQKFYYY